MDNEIMAKRIKDKLIDICPALQFKDTCTVTWHGCKCLVGGGSCECVWHLSDTCHQGKWKQLSPVARRARNLNTKAQRLSKKVKKAIKG